jgi:hypothetical protein
MICCRAGSDHKKGVAMGNKFWTFCYTPLYRTGFVGREVFDIMRRTQVQAAIKRSSCSALIDSGERSKATCGELWDDLTSHKTVFIEPSHAIVVRVDWW